MRMKNMKKAPRTKRAARTIVAKRPAKTAGTEQFKWMTSSHAIVLGMMFVVVTAALLTAREEIPRAGVEPTELTELTAMPATVESNTPRAAQTRVIETKKPAAMNMTPAPIVPDSPAATAPSAAPEQPAALTTTASTTLAVEPPAESKAVTTITGCLENDEGTFQLAEASGAAAPTARSWKSGFLKKRAAHVELVDTFGLNLRQYVGRRVSVTGTLVERDMRARSVRLIGACE